ncbi:MAG TPA: deoxyribonuclease V [Pantanalinema sp.]
MNRPEWIAPQNPTEAVAIQRVLAASVRCRDEVGEVRAIAGVDVSTQRWSDDGFAAIVVLEFPSLEVIEVAQARMRLTMPYIPGLLSFREIPILLAAWERLGTDPDLIVVDGQGRAHPRRFGIASHLGVLLDRPTIGCAKSLLTGVPGMLSPERGSLSALMAGHEQVGYAVRTKDRVNPVYVSCGHRISDETAAQWVLACARGYRLPEPTRQAHLASNALRRRLTT